AASSAQAAMSASRSSSPTVNLLTSTTGPTCSSSSCLANGVVESISSNFMTPSFRVFDSSFRGGTESAAQLVEQPFCGFHVRLPKLVREPFCPLDLDALGGGVDRGALSRQHIQRRPRMARIGLRRDEALIEEEIQLLLRALTGHAHPDGQLRRRARRVRQGHGPQHLPARARQLQVCDKAVSRREQLAVDAEDEQDDVGEQPAPSVARSRWATHDNQFTYLTTSCQIARPVRAGSLGERGLFPGVFRGPRATVLRRIL